MYTYICVFKCRLMCAYLFQIRRRNANARIEPVLALAPRRAYLSAGLVHVSERLEKSRPGGFTFRRRNIDRRTRSEFLVL